MRTLIFTEKECRTLKLALELAAAWERSLIEKLGTDSLSRQMHVSANTNVQRFRVLRDKLR